MVYSDPSPAGSPPPKHVDPESHRQLDDRLLQFQKMEVIGHLAGGIAHDFNNLLTVISGYVELTLGGMQPGDPNHESLLEVRSAANKAATLTQKLLAFSRQQTLQSQLLNLNDAILANAKILRRVITEDINISCRLAALPQVIRVDPLQLEQVLLNLAVNARDAMPRGGKLTLETRQVELNDADCRSSPELRIGLYVVLSVSDTGCGIPPELLPRIFDPFVSTKETGKGTGLGLAMVCGFVRQSGGYITVTSKVGNGTKFNLYFPVQTSQLSAGLLDSAEAVTDPETN